MVKFHIFHLFSVALGFIAIAEFPAIAERNDLASLTLAIDSDRSMAMVTGFTGGSYSLASITNRDRYGNPCMGYSDPKPDHKMVLENDFTQLSLKVDSGGKDTTLVIKGPGNNNIRCGFGQQQIRDALVKDENWQAGKYEIWVGSMQPNYRSNYRLSVQP